MLLHFGIYHYALLRFEIYYANLIIESRIWCPKSASASSCCKPPSRFTLVADNSLVQTIMETLFQQYESRSVADSLADYDTCGATCSYCLFFSGGVHRVHVLYAVRTARWRTYNFYCASYSTNLHGVRLSPLSLCLYGTVQGVRKLRTLYRLTLSFSDSCAFCNNETMGFVVYADNRGERIPRSM
jgi:hypothetical protein